MNNYQSKEKNGDEWGLEIRTGIGRRVDHQKLIAEIKSREEPLVAAVKKHNTELRKWIKWIGISATTLLIALILVGIKDRGTESWLILIVLMLGSLFLAKYDSLKKRGILICKNCLEEFVPKENDSDKKCPYCEQGHTAEYL